MDERLVTGRHNDDIYDPFESPPNIQKAQNHRKAMAVGNQFDDDQENPKICPCCENAIEKQPISLFCDDQVLLFLGIGYPLFYKLYRYIALIITSIFVISGSAYYFLITIKCQTNCIYFFGIPIINLQIPPSDTLQITDIVNLITSFVILAIVLLLKSRIHQDIASLQSQVISPEQYTIIVQNLPEDVTENDLNTWCLNNFGVTPTTINFAYNVNELTEAYSKRHDLTIALNKLLINLNDRQDYLNNQNKNATEDEISEYKKSIKHYDKILNNYKRLPIPSRKNGTVFLTFSQQKTVQNILEKHKCSFFRFFINMIEATIWKPSCITYKKMIVIINRAPAPKQIIWKNLSFSFFKRIGAQFLFIATMATLIFIGFRVQYVVIEYAYQLRVQSQTGQVIIIIQALIMSLIVVLLNSLLRLVIKFFASIKKYYSYSSYHSSFCFYYSIMYSINTCFMIYLVHGHRNEIGQSGIGPENQLLIYDIHLIMLANAFSEPLFKIFDPIMWWRILWRNYIKNLQPQKNPYTQAYVNALWEGYEISNADNYQYIFRMLIVSTWYAHAAPLGVVISLVGLFVDYWIGKFLLLRVYKKPENISKEIASPILFCLELMPLIYICGALQYTYKTSDSSDVFSFLFDFLEYGVATTVLIVSILGCFVLKKPEKFPLNQKDYSEYEQNFPYNYETENPLTKFTGEINFLYKVLRKGTQDAKLIGQLIEMKRKSKEEDTERQSEIAIIKRRQLKKATTLNSFQMRDMSASSD